MQRTENFIFITKQIVCTRIYTEAFYLISWFILPPSIDILLCFHVGVHNLKMFSFSCLRKTEGEKFAEGFNAKPDRFMTSICHIYDINFNFQVLAFSFHFMLFYLHSSDFGSNSSLMKNIQLECIFREYKRMCHDGIQGRMYRPLLLKKLLSLHLQHYVWLRFLCDHFLDETWCNSTAEFLK